MDEIARKLYSDHKNPLTKFELPAQKFFFKASIANEAINEHQDNLEKNLRHQKVERRCARVQAEWQLDIELAKVKKSAKGLIQQFGFQDKTGIFLYPEETLYLLEMNRLELNLEGLPVSIQDCFNLVFKSPDYNFNQYKVYKKLALQGYRLVRYSEMLKRKNKINQDKSYKIKRNKKHKIEVTEELQEAKKICQRGIRKAEKQTQEKFQLQFVYNIFAEIQKKAPLDYSLKTSNVYIDYSVFVANNKSRTDCDFNLSICETSILDKLNEDMEKPVIYGICCGENISFYKFSSVNLPSLINR